MRRIVGVMLVAGMAAAPASAMSVAEFIGKVDAIKANPFLYFTNVSALKAEGMAAGAAWQAQIAPPGRKPNACPPPTAKKMGNSEFLAMMQAVPAAQRTTTSVTQATIAGLNLRYPCKG
jgi:hypothetical protein